MREDILADRLAAGIRLSSTRALAAQLSVPLNTVMSAFTRSSLRRATPRAGTYVADVLPDDLLRAGSEKGRRLGQTNSSRGLGRRGEVLAATPATTIRDLGMPRAFRVGVSAPEGFPSRAWARIAGRVWRPPRGLLGYAAYEKAEILADACRLAEALR